MLNFNSNLLITQIYKSRKNILELMDTQDYDISGYANSSITEISSMIQTNQLDMLLETKNEVSNKKKVYIRYYLSKTLRPSNLYEMIDDLFILSETLTKNDTLYIIIKEELPETLINELKHIWEKDKIFIVIESLKKLQFNILKHILVPTHKILDDDQLTQVMKKYNITNNEHFPTLSRFDPVARAIGIRPGQVCHIIRPSKTAIQTDYYRLCI